MANMASPRSRKVRRDFDYDRRLSLNQQEELKSPRMKKTRGSIDLELVCAAGSKRGGRRQSLPELEIEITRMRRGSEPAAFGGSRKKFDKDQDIERLRLDRATVPIDEEYVCGVKKDEYEPPMEEEVQQADEGSSAAVHQEEEQQEVDHQAPPMHMLTQVAKGEQPKKAVRTQPGAKGDLPRAGIMSRLFSCFPSCVNAPPPEIAQDDEEEAAEEFFLPPPLPEHVGRKCLVIDLDETLVHSNFKYTGAHYDFKSDMVCNGMNYEIFVAKRPGCEEFLKKAALTYELAIFTASVPEYANGVIDYIDPDGLVTHRLFRKQCTFFQNEIYVKDLLRIGRDIEQTVILDNNPDAYLFQPENAIPINSWYDDQEDRDLQHVTTILDLVAESQSSVASLAIIDSKLGWGRQSLHHL